MGLGAGSLEGVGLMHEFWACRRVLLTGHTGFKGSWLALWLSELGARVTGVGLEPDTTPNLFGQLELARRLERHHIADIREPEALAQIVQDCQPQVVFHLAASRWCGAATATRWAPGPPTFRAACTCWRP